MFAEVLLRGFTIRNVRRIVCNTDGARREALRACLFVLSDRITPFVGVEHDGVRYLLSSHEAGVSYPTFMRGYFDEDTLRHTMTALSSHAGIDTIAGLTVLEIGANIGTETVSLLARHGVARVVAIEPDHENVRFLRANLALNGLQDRAAIFEMALSDIDGVALLENSRGNWGDHRVRVASTPARGPHDERLRRTSEVQAQRLDSLAEAGRIDLMDIDLVWMDAQGHEGHILAGAQQLLTAHIPIVTEYWPDGLRRAGALERFHALIAERHSAIVDLREPTVALGVEHIPTLEARYSSKHPDDRTVPYTDLLLLPP